MHALVALVVGVAVGACASPGGVRASLPEPPPGEITIAPSLPPGEHTTWNVFVGSINVGRADQRIDPAHARTSFRTGVLASVVEPLRLELVTTLADGRARAVHETLARAGHTTRQSTPIDDPRLHSLHTALGALRAWSRARPRAGFLWLVHEQRRVRLDVTAPVRDEALGLPALRVDGIARSVDAPPLRVSLWLAANRERTPLRLTVDGDGVRVSAEAIESTAAFD